VNEGFISAKYLAPRMPLNRGADGHVGGRKMSFADNQNNNTSRGDGQRFAVRGLLFMVMPDMWGCGDCEVVPGTLRRHAACWRRPVYAGTTSTKLANRSRLRPSRRAFERRPGVQRYSHAARFGYGPSLPNNLCHLPDKLIWMSAPVSDGPNEEVRVPASRAST